VLMAAGLLRKLLLEGEALVDIVNRPYRERLRFRANVAEPIWMRVNVPKPNFYSVQDGLDPETAPPGARSAGLTKDDFLKLMVLLAQGAEFTVKDVISQVANVSGAVKAGKPRSEEEELLVAVSDSFRIGGYDPVVRTLQPIGRIVLRALAPLRERDVTGQ
jgi:hypothetical protein